jgi:hypothetical protein
LKKEHLILIAAGIILAYFLYKRSKGLSVPNNTIKPGDKSNEVYGLQSALASMTGLKFDNMGAYDTDTLNAVQYYLKDTNSLLDYEKGYVNKSFASDLFLIQDKLKK